MSRLVRVELLKLRTVRTTYGLLAAAALLTALLAASSASKPSLAGRGGHASASALSAAVTQTGWVMLFATVMGVIAASGEFRQSTATFTYLAGPRRDRVLAAKAVAATVVGAIFGLIGAVVATGIGLAATFAAGNPITLGAATFVRDDLGTVLGAALLAALGVAVGSLIRSQVAGIVAILIWSLVIEPIIGGLFTAIQPYLPYTAATTLAGVKPGTGSGGVHVSVNHNGTAAVAPAPLPFGAAVALLGALVIVVSVIAARSRLRADIT
jgi:ABC-2 type transport system permease protein